jgi:small subunit ribosomal protein S6
MADTARYELMVIGAPQESSGSGDGIAQAMEKILTKFKVKTVALDDWGDKTLAHQIRKYDRGHYLVYDLELETGVIEKLKSQFKLEKDLLRYLFLKKEI